MKTKSLRDVIVLLILVQINSSCPARTTHLSHVFRSKALFVTLTMVSMENPIANCLPCFIRTDVILFTSQYCHTFQLMPQRFAIKNVPYNYRKNFQKRLKFTIGLFQREVISMQSNFNSLHKSNQMSERKCRAVFLTDNKRSLEQRIQFFCLPLIWCENANFVHLMKSQITRKWIKLCRPLFMHYARTRVGDTLQ